MSERSEVRPVEDAFAEAGFAEPDYAFYPANNRFIGAIFRRLWLVPAVLLVLVLALNLATYLSLTGESNREQINDWLSDIVSVQIHPAAFDRLTDEENRKRIKAWFGDYLIFSEEDWNIVLYRFPSRFHRRPESSEVYAPIDELREWSRQDFERFAETFFRYRLISGSLVDTRYYVAPILAALFIAGFLIPRFMYMAPKLLFALAQSGRLHPATERQRRLDGLSWKTFAVHLDRLLASPRRWPFVVATTAVCIGVTLWISRERGSFDWLIKGSLEGVAPLRVPIDVAYEYLVIVGFPLVIGPVIGLTVWLLLIVARHISLMPAVFDIELQPAHRDRCGGLKRVGDICLNMTGIVMVAGIVIAFAYLAGIIAGSIPAIAQVVYLSIVLILLLSLATFFVPVWRLHQLMIDRRESFRDNAAALEMPMRREAHRLIQSEELDVDRLEALEQRRALHEILFPPDLRYPTWPFSTGMRLAFVAGLAPQIAALIAGRFLTNPAAVDGVAETLSRFLVSGLSGQ